MGTRTITTDDFTSAEIEGPVCSLTLTASFTRPNEDGEMETIEVSGKYDVTELIGNTMVLLVDTADLATVIARTRGMVKVTALDPDVIRKWAANHEPKIELNARGRIPAEVQAQYRREVIEKATAGDSNAATANAELDAKRAAAEEASNAGGRENGSKETGK